MEINPVDFLVCFILFNLLLKVGYPLSGFLHELGHGFTGLLLTRKSKVRIYFGRCGENPTLRFGRLCFHIGPTTHFHGTCEIDADLPPRHVLLIAAAGPLISCALAIVSLQALFNASFPWGFRLIAGVLFYANCRLFISSAAPRMLDHPHVSGKSSPSDGLRILEILKPKGERD